MPSKSPAQARLMRAVSHGWNKPGGGGPTRAVAKEFVESDRRGKVQGYNFGGVATGPGMYGGGKPMGPLSRDPRAMPPQASGGRPAMNVRSPMQRRPQIKPQRPDPRMMPQRGGLGQVGQAMMRQGKGPPNGRRMVPPSPPRGYPGGGNPMMGGRNPMMRQANQRRPMMGGRGATSYLR